MASDRIIQAAIAAYRVHWRPTSDEGTGDRQAKAVTDAWQAAVRGPGIECELHVAPGLNERLDVVDLNTHTAYEFKVSGKNPHHEFYRDVFKVFIHNRMGGGRVGRLVFLTGEKGARALKVGLGSAVTQHAQSLGFAIEIHGI
jgi:hypothetical protein